MLRKNTTIWQYPGFWSQKNNCAIHSIIVFLLLQAKDNDICWQQASSHQYSSRWYRWYRILDIRVQEAFRSSGSFIGVYRGCEISKFGWFLTFWTWNHTRIWARFVCSLGAFCKHGRNSYDKSVIFKLIRVYATPDLALHCLSLCFPLGQDLQKQGHKGKLECLENRFVGRKMVQNNI
jgi:hypothetical protein